MQLTIHRGAKEVGGTCVEISAGQSRILLDIGLPLFDEDREPLDSLHLRRLSKDDLLAKGILPNIPGLFGKGPAIDGILLSHAHLDHTGLLGHSHETIPVYTSRGTSKMMLAGRLFAAQVELPRERFRQIRNGQPVQIGDFRITGFDVDHSIFGSMAILIEAEGRKVLYSGDLRLHGRKPGMTRRLIEVASEHSINVLLMEGTHFGFPDGNDITEYELEDAIVELVAKESSLVLTSFSPQHVDRLVAFIRAAKKTGRVFIADVYTAFILHLISSETPVPIPGKDDLVRVFFPRSFTDSAQRRGLKKISEQFEASRIGMDEIIADPHQYLMVFRPSMLEPEFSGKLPTATTCIYSRWTGYLEKPDWGKTKEKIAEASGKLIELHTSGHILSADIVRFVESISPATIIPVHTFEPKEFKKQFENVSVVADRQVFQIT